MQVGILIIWFLLFIIFILIEGIYGLALNALVPNYLFHKKNNSILNTFKHIRH